jgi:hypothetical protein
VELQVVPNLVTLEVYAELVGVEMEVVPEVLAPVDE